ncbi:thiamine biosynthesis lipoprotein [Ferrimonas marina]|uniref:FAD:protein FMN transferase n=1 Tax=Ferrimonas marina TaxID=299255 RepID=A0A1M5NSX2_9GAMM|nr:thiamine biosynthesis lipoprotein [Ferrimonas marina]
MLTQHANHFVGRFQAMASPCELLMDTRDPALAKSLLTLAAQHTWAFEAKFSRYRDDSLCQQINQSRGRPVAIDAEAYRLLSFADRCYQLSDGLFDLTSGVLRRIWRFEPGAMPPSQAEISKCLSRIGWHRVRFNQQQVVLPDGMELDFGGIGKEYAVDRCAALLAQRSPTTPVLVNFGGDIALSRPRGNPWQIGIADTPAITSELPGPIALAQGALATSGDTHRCLVHNGIRYSHILNPKTGWATHGGPRQLTVAGDSCLHAGLLATLALLHGDQAEAFIRQQDVDYWVTP